MIVFLSFVFLLIPPAFAAAALTYFFEDVYFSLMVIFLLIGWAIFTGCFSYEQDPGARLFSNSRITLINIIGYAGFALILIALILRRYT